MPANSVTVGGEISWDMVISLIISLVTAAGAYFGLKFEVRHNSSNIEALEEEIENIDNDVKNYEKELLANIEIKRNEVLNELEKLKSELAHLKESTHKDIITDLKELEDKLKRDIDTTNVRIEKERNDIDRTILDIEKRINEKIKNDIKTIHDKHTSHTEAIFKRIDEFKDIKNDVLNDIKNIYIQITDIKSKFLALETLIKSESQKTELITENIHTILDMLKSDIDNIKSHLQFFSKLD